MILIFDFDGTIHNTEIAYKKAIEKSLAELNLDIKDYEYKSFIGMSPKKAWDIILGNDEDKDPYIKKNGGRIIEFMEKEGALYEGAFDTLNYLKNKYDLYILSKCRQAYMKAARKKFDLDRYFKGCFVAEDYNFIGKYKILRKEVKSDYIMIGDRREDVEAGVRNKQKSIFASYGFGNKEESEGADMIISDIRDLMNIF